MFWHRIPGIERSLSTLRRNDGDVCLTLQLVVRVGKLWEVPAGGLASVAHLVVGAPAIEQMC
jgi:hypothetical protein